jgi:predicted Fe-Mo cluster-binding NifX family protein
LSIASFLPGADQPIVWRGPRKSAAIRQFLGQGNWSGVDVLVVDCPPGTGDEPMSVAQLIPDADGVVIVTSPQDVALLDSRKCVSFVRDINHRVLGIVENLSGFVCPDCGKQISLFKVGGGEKAAHELDVPFLGRIPITEELVKSGDSGRPLTSNNPQDKASLALIAMAKTIEKNWLNGRTADHKSPSTGGNKKAKGAKMRIVIAADDDKGLDGQVSMHFGRCPYYVLADVENGKVVACNIEENAHFGSHVPGQMPAYIRDLGADVILAGGMGPQAVNLFQSYGIDVATGAAGNVNNVLEAYLAGEFKGTEPCHHDHPESCGGH